MLSSASFRTIIHRYVPRRSPFDKTNMIPYYVPRTGAPHKRQEKWDDPDYNWPPKMERYTQLQGKALVQQLEKEYMEELKKEKKYDDIRTGDLIEVQNYYSLSNKQFSTFKGLCIARKRKNGLDSSLNVIGFTSNTQMEMHIKLYSPLVKSVKILEHGSGNHRARLNYFREVEIKNHKALVKGAVKRYKPLHIARQEEKAMRYKILTNKMFDEKPAEKPTENKPEEAKQ